MWCSVDDVVSGMFQEHFVENNFVKVRMGRSFV